MGTRADFYVGRGETAEWLGSIAWDGYPEGVGAVVLQSRSKEGYRSAVSKFFDDRDDATPSSMGWPWPWDTSHTTDYAYAFDGDRVWVSNYGEAWEDASAPRVEPEPVVFPDMSGVKAVSLGKRSGTITIASGPDGYGIVED